MIHMTTKKGFTLAELIVSIAIFLVMFTVLTQGFLTVLKISHQIEVNRELTLYSSKILNALATDIDELRIDTTIDEFRIDTSAANSDTSFTLSSRDGSKKVIYTLEKMKERDRETYYKDRQVEKTADAYTLSRKVNNEPAESYLSQNFVLIAPHFKKIPDASTSLSKCDYIPALLFSATVLYIPKKSGDFVETSSYLQTTFSTPEDPLQFSQTCK